MKLSVFVGSSVTIFIFVEVAEGRPKL